MYLPDLRGEVSQGDIFDTLPIAYVRYGFIRRLRVRNVRSILLTYDCEYDKPATQFVMIAEIRPLSEVARGSQGNIRNNRVAAAFFLETFPPLLGESYVNFRCMGRVDKRIVTARANDRLTSLDEDTRLALQEQLSGFFGYGRS